MDRNNITVIILAAGKGTRMKTDLPKVFHKLKEKPLLEHVLGTVQKLDVDSIYIVVGHKKEMIIDYFKKRPVTFVEQKEQLGTGHAVKMVEPFLENFDGTVLVLAGDVPLISVKTLSRLIAFHESKEASATDLTAELPDAGNYGRIIRDSEGKILKIVEKKDAAPEELAIREINTGTFCFNAKDLFWALSKLRKENAQKEFYLTDTIEILREEGKAVFAFLADNYKETLGINTKEELSAMESEL